MISHVPAPRIAGVMTAVPRQVRRNDLAAQAKFVAATGVDPKKAAMFEDLSRNLEAPKALGMATVLIVPGGAVLEALGEAWELEGRDAPYVDFVTDNLAVFLEDIRREMRPR